MFCTKCGKKIYEEDRFCASCGAEVRRESKPVKAVTYDDVVFNPPFKVAAQKRTEEIIGFKKEEPKEEPRVKVEKPKERERVYFDWNLDGYPSANPRKTEEVNFNWGSVVEKRQTQSGFGMIIEDDKHENKPQEDKVEQVIVEKIVPSSILSNYEEDKSVSEKIYSFEKELEELEKSIERSRNIPKEIAVDSFSMDETIEEDEPLTIEDLEKELFGGNDITNEGDASEEIASKENTTKESTVKYTPVNADKFYTYNQKAMAFEALVEKEKARLDSLGIDVNKEKDSDLEEDSDLVCVVQPITPNTISIEEKIDYVEDATKEEAAFEQAEVKEEATSEQVEAKESEVKEEATSEQVEAKESEIEEEAPSEELSSEEAEAEKEQSTEAKKETTSEEKKEKSVDLDSIFGQDDEDDEPKKKRIFVKLIIALLVILICIEGFVIGVKLIAPDSQLAEKTDNMIALAIDKLMGIERIDSQGDDIPSYDSSDYMAGIVAEATSEFENTSKEVTIGRVEYDKDLKYDKNKSYVFDEIPTTVGFVDTEWLAEDGEATTTYGKQITLAVIDYYEGWKEINTDEELVGINQLSIGEIRTGEKGFYILCKLIYAGNEGDEIESYQSVYAIVSGDKIVVDTIKEETL